MTEHEINLFCKKNGFARVGSTELLRKSGVNEEEAMLLKSKYKESCMIFDLLKTKTHTYNVYMEFAYGV